MMVDSQQAFAGLRTEMDKLTKKTKRLETENAEMQRKAKASDVALLQLVDERNEAQKALRTAVVQKDKLAALCRTLQERQKQAAGGEQPVGDLPVAAGAEAGD